MPKQTTCAVALVLLFWQLAAQVKSTTVIRAAYPATPARQQTLTQTLEFTYLEGDFKPPYRIPAEPQQNGSFRTPEETMSVRASAMISQDYDLWLSTWDDSARAQFLHESTGPAAVAERKRQWRAMFSVSQMVLFKRIETREFVILTYKMLDEQGRNVGQFELPSVFQKIGNRWIGTQRLAADPLLIESPWISMQSMVVREVK